MKKIRINELARELEVKPNIILDLLPDLGVAEKKTHSSSIDEDVAVQLKNRLGIEGDLIGVRSYTDSDDDETVSSFVDTRHDVDAGEHESPVRPVEQSLGEQSLFQREQDSLQQRPAPPVPAPTAALPAQPTEESPSAPAPQPEAPAPIVRPMQPLRPPLMAGAGRTSPIHPPLRSESPAAPASETAPKEPAVAAPAPAAPLAPAASAPSQPAPVSPAAPSAPRPSEPPRMPAPPRPALGSPTGGVAPSGAMPGTPTLPAPPAQAATPGTPAPRPAPPPRPQPPVRNQPLMQQARPGQILSGPRQPLPGMTEMPRPSIAPGTPRPPAPPPPRPFQQPRPPMAPPGGPGAQSGPRAPQAPSGPPAGQGQNRPYAGQPAARPVVPPNPAMQVRLAQNRNLPTAPSAAAPGAPRPGMPTRPPMPSQPTPGRPMYSGPRPGQPSPGRPMQGGPSGFNRPGGPPRMGSRGMHPTSPIRPDMAPPPMPATDPGRRHAVKRPTPQDRHREQEEGRLRPMVSRREQQAAPPPIDREITISEGITVKELSEKLGVKANLVIKKLVERKIFATINQALDVQMAQDLARDFGASINQVSYEEESIQDIGQTEVDTDLQRRGPVVTIMGHVDHGKTSLLDAIRSANVADREAGGITQHIGAYQVEQSGQKVVFIDTPGHEAFTRMRARGAKVTDVVVLVVSADDGVMPQTLEAIDHARAAKVPIVVAINKIDKPDANPDRIKQQLADRGLLAEDYGGDTPMVPVSARTKQNLDLLLEMILLVADIQDLKANATRPGVGSVLEAKLDRGRGPVATVLVHNGTLRQGDFFICGSVFGKVRAIYNDRGEQVKEAGPSTPVEVLGLETLPDVGDTFQVVTDTAKAKQIVMFRESRHRELNMNKGMRVTLDQLQHRLKESEKKELLLVLKADVGGTAEVLSDSLQRLSNDKVTIRVLSSGVGAVNESDVLLASASEAVVIGFNVRPEKKAESLAELEKVEIRQYNIIYELIDDMKKAMVGLLDPVYREVFHGRAEVREVFRITKVGTVAGCMITEGFVKRGDEVRLMRENVVVHTGKVEALKRFKDDASEVRSGFECGISIVNYSDLKQGDMIEAFVNERVAHEVFA